MSYYNTTKEIPEQVEMFSDKNRKQDDIVLNIALSLNKPFSASQIWKLYPIANSPITSIRRSLNTLNYKLNVIRQTGEKVKGLYGRNELEYEIN